MIVPERRESIVKKLSRVMVVVAVLLLCLVGPAVARAQEPWYSALVPDAVGTRVTSFWLLDHSRDKNHFLGSIDELHARQDYLPYKVFLDWDLGRYAFVDLTWDKISADAQSRHGRDDTDGIVDMGGPILTVNLRYPNKTPLTPYAGIGIAPWSATFDHASWHEYGFSSVAAWEAAGKPDHSINGKTRPIILDDSVGFVAAAGLGYALTGHWSLDLYGRYVNISTDYTYSVYVNGKHRAGGSGSFPLSNIAAGLGVNYSFL